MTLRSFLALLALLLSCDAIGAQRPLRVDDLLQLAGYETSGVTGAATVVVSAEGAAAFIRTRPARTLTRFPIGWDIPLLRGNTDVWVQTGPGETSRNVTHGER